MLGSGGLYSCVSAPEKAAARHVSSSPVYIHDVTEPNVLTLQVV